MADAGQLDQSGPPAAAGVLLLPARRLSVEVKPRPIVSVPSGNFGNLTAGLIAKRIGLPIRRSSPRPTSTTRCRVYLRSGAYEPRPSIATVANAMDVGAPSNFERVQALYNGDLDGAAPGHRRLRLRRRQVIAEIAACTGATATCSIRTAPSPGWPCRTLDGPRRDRRVPGHGASGEVPRGRRTGDRPQHRAAARRCRCACAAENSVPMPADYTALEEFLRASRHSVQTRFGRGLRVRERSRDSETYRPSPGDLPATPSHRATRGTSAPICPKLGRVAGAYRELDARSIEAFKSATGHASAGRGAAGGVPAMDEMGALSYRVWYFAALRYDEDQRNNEINARRQQVQILFAASSRPAPGSTPSCWPFRSRPSASGWKPTPPRASTGSRSRACSTSRSTCSTSRASGCCRMRAASTACRTTATRR